jgi:hypothetical protein
MLISFTNSSQYRSSTGIEMKNNVTIKMLIPRQLAPTMLPTPDIKMTAFVSAVVVATLSLFTLNPAVSYLVNQLLGLISSLGIITHYAIIDLAYPV